MDNKDSLNLKSYNIRLIKTMDENNGNTMKVVFKINKMDEI